MASNIRNAQRGMTTLCGGTRVTVKTDRPWQPKLVFPKNREECRFCSVHQEDEIFVAADWKSFRNSNTPFPSHRLLVPTECWDEEKLRSLGGFLSLRRALTLAIREVERMRCGVFPTWIYTHIGYSAGQNLTHQHWHLCGAPTRPEYIDQGAVERDGVCLLREPRLDAYLYGVRAGQVIIMPNRGRTTRAVFDPESADFAALIALTDTVIKKYNRKFNYPDYILFLALNAPDDIHIRYTPILNNWGGSEFAALDYGTPFVLPWPHEATKDFLLSE